VSGSTAKRTSSVEGTERLGAALAPAMALGDVVSLSLRPWARMSMKLNTIATSESPANELICRRVACASSTS